MTLKLENNLYANPVYFFIIFYTGYWFINDEAVSWWIYASPGFNTRNSSDLIGLNEILDK